MGTGTLNASNDLVGSVKEASFPSWRAFVMGLHKEPSMSTSNSGDGRDISIMSIEYRDVSTELSGRT